MVAASAERQAIEVDVQHPITAGDVAIIYARARRGKSAGSGGSAASSSPLTHTVNPVTVTIGGVNVKVQFRAWRPVTRASIR